jgi:hypothetical protein
MAEARKSRPGFRRIENALGPGLVTGAADDDPSGTSPHRPAQFDPNQALAGIQALKILG